MERIKNKNRTICFYDLESTSVARDADMISVGLVAVTDTDSTNMLGERQRKIKTLYAEFDDFNINKCDDWVKENIVGKLYLETAGYSNLDKHITKKPFDDVLNNTRFEMKGSKEVVSFMLKKWLSQFESVEFWCDFGVIDAPMLIDLIADWDYQNNKKDVILDFKNATGTKYKVGLPKHLPNVAYYDFYDIHTLFKFKGIDPDINREDFSEVFGGDIPLIMEPTGGKHNPLWDAYVTWKCYDKIMNR